ncbi:MAG: DUF4349 domain-containing protein [Actinobacteria bacterium]|nr:DUF4349 domain-containing protein [Actinomycetota bacterium]
MRPRDTLTAAQERELEAIDRALAGEPVEHELREFDELVRDVRATAPEMSAGFAARLERELQAGFPAAQERSLRRRGRRAPWAGRRWLLLPVAGSLATVLVALVVVLAGNGGTGTIESFSGEAAPIPAERDVSADSAGGGSAGEGRGAAGGARPAPEPTAKSAPPVVPAQPPPPSAGAVAPGRARKVQRSASITLETPQDEFARTTAAVNSTVARFGAIVASSQIGESDAGGSEATYDLRIPSDRLDRALAALSKLGHVTERSQALDDITASFQSAQERLTEVRAERRGLLRALERATTQAQIDSLKARLRSAGGQISALKRRLAALRRRADLATVSLTVRGSDESTQTGGGGQWTPGDAAADAVRVLEVLAGVLLIGLAILVPAGLLAAAVALGVRFGRRLRREAALDPA